MQGNQLSEQADARLHELSRDIGREKEVIERSQKIYDREWDEVANLLAEFNTDRFLASDGFYLQIQKRESQPKLDGQKLARAIQGYFGRTAGRKVWDAITTRVVEPALLEQAVAQGKIPPELLNDCLEPGRVTTARVRQPWTKEDKERLEILGGL